MKKNIGLKKYLVITLMMIGVFFMVGFKSNDCLNKKCQGSETKIEEKDDKETLEQTEEKKKKDDKETLEQTEEKKKKDDKETLEQTEEKKEKDDKETLEQTEEKKDKSHKETLEKEDKIKGKANEETTKSNEDIKNKPGVFGKIEEIRKEGENTLIRVKGDKHAGYMFDELVAVINENTKIKDKCGNIMKVENLKEGTLVAVEVGDAVTNSLPPQGVAKYIEIQQCTKGDVEGIVEKIEKNKKDNTLGLTVKGEKNENFTFNEAIVLVNEETQIYDSCGNKLLMKSIKKGSNIQVIFNGPVTKSIPPQGTAKIIFIK